MSTDSITLSPAYNGDSVPITAGMIVRLKAGANNNVVRACADSAPNIQGMNGVVLSGSSAPGTSVLLTAIGRQTVQMESGLTLAAGQTVYVSPNIAGKGTNVVPAQISPIGSIADVTSYSRTGTVEVDVNVATTAAANNAIANWPLPVSAAVPNTRWYALDVQTGDDSRAGCSDVSAAAAGQVAVRTAARLNALLLSTGNGRNCVVLVGVGIYNEWLSFASGRYGYNTLVIQPPSPTPHQDRSLSPTVHRPHHSWWRHCDWDERCWLQPHRVADDSHDSRHGGGWWRSIVPGWGSNFDTGWNASSLRRCNSHTCSAQRRDDGRQGLWG